MYLYKYMETSSLIAIGSCIVILIIVIFIIYKRRIKKSTAINNSKVPENSVTNDELDNLISEIEKEQAINLETSES